MEDLSLGSIRNTGRAVDHQERRGWVALKGEEGERGKKKRARVTPSRRIFETTRTRAVMTMLTITMTKGGEGKTAQALSCTCRVTVSIARELDVPAIDPLQLDRWGDGSLGERSPKALVDTGCDQGLRQCCALAKLQGHSQERACVCRQIGWSARRNTIMVSKDTNADACHIWSQRKIGSGTEDSHFYSFQSSF